MDIFPIPNQKYSLRKKKSQKLPRGFKSSKFLNFELMIFLYFELVIFFIFQLKNMVRYSWESWRLWWTSSLAWTESTAWSMSLYSPYTLSLASKTITQSTGGFRKRDLNQKAWENIQLNWCRTFYCYAVDSIAFFLGFSFWSNNIIIALIRSDHKL